MIFDCWTSYGIGPGQDDQERRTLVHLLEDLDHFGVAGALVRHEQVLHYDPMFCNRRLLAELAPHRKKLFPCWSAIPHQYGDFPTAAEFLREADAGDVRAFCIQPKLHGVPTDAGEWRELADALNRRQALILTPLPEFGDDFDKARNFCRIFKDCPIVITEASWPQWRLVYALMNACPNTYLEFHLFQANRAVEFFANRFGVDRLLFGSGLVRRSAGAARGFVDWSLLPDEAVAKFAGANLRRLLGAGPSSAPAVPEDADLIVRAARAGQPLPVLTLDAHTHVLHKGLHSAGRQYVMMQGDWQGMRELTQRMGITLTALMSWNGTVNMDVESGNELIAELVQEYGTEIVGLSSCNPIIQDATAIRKMCEWMHLKLGCRGMKPYYTNGLSYADDRYAPWWKFCNQHRLYGLLHISADAGGYTAVTELAQRYPKATFLIAHAAGSWTAARAAAELIQKHKNVMAEITLTPVCNGTIEYLCRTAGADRVLFGTDAPMRDPRPQLGWCVYARLNVEEKKQVLGENFRRILRRGNLPGHTLPACLSAS
ncbi:MAG: amidohydrolase family protein [Kiritimatiellia bacterium]